MIYILYLTAFLVGIAIPYICVESFKRHSKYLDVTRKILESSFVESNIINDDDDNRVN